LEFWSCLDSNMGDRTVCAQYCIPITAGVLLLACSEPSGRGGHSEPLRGLLNLWKLSQTTLFVDPTILRQQGGHAYFVENYHFCLSPSKKDGQEEA